MKQSRKAKESELTQLEIKSMLGLLRGRLEDTINELDNDTLYDYDMLSDLYECALGQNDPDAVRLKQLAERFKNELETEN